MIHTKHIAKLAALVALVSSVPSALADTSVPLKSWHYNGQFGTASGSVSAQYGTSGLSYNLVGSADLQNQTGATLTGDINGTSVPGQGGTASGDLSITTASGKTYGGSFTSTSTDGQGINTTVNTDNHGSFQISGSRTTGFTVTPSGYSAQSTSGFQSHKL